MRRLRSVFASNDRPNVFAVDDSIRGDHSAGGSVTSVGSRSMIAAGSSVTRLTGIFPGQHHAGHANAPFERQALRDPVAVPHFHPDPSEARCLT